MNKDYKGAVAPNEEEKIAFACFDEITAILKKNNVTEDLAFRILLSMTDALYFKLISEKEKVAEKLKEE